MRRALFLTTAIVTLALPAAAWGGGFSTIGLQELPGSLRAGQTWTAEFTVLGHGRTPQSRLQPFVTISRPDGSGRIAFRAVESSGEAGEYRSRVRFPADGRWAVAISEWRDAGGRASPGHTFGTIDVGRAGTAGGDQALRRDVDGGQGWQRALLALGAGLLATAAVALLARRRTDRSLPSRPPAPA